MTNLTFIDRARGMLLGLACGDAVGAAVEFKPRGSFPLVTDLLGGGKFRLEPGEWTDDTSMALCIADSLLASGGFNAADQMARYKQWIDTGYRSCKPHPIGIGKTVLQAMMRYQRSGEPFCGSTDARSAGNGALMRLAPIPLFYSNDLALTRHFAMESTRTTHAPEECLAASELFSELLHHALHGRIAPSNSLPVSPMDTWPDSIKALARGEFRNKSYEELKGSGYVVESLEAALWCWDRAKDYESAILLAVNLGDDADTTAAICGQLAGATHGESNIPIKWLNKLVGYDELINLAERLANQKSVPAAPTGSDQL